jgi:hypothetical protein
MREKFLELKKKYLDVLEKEEIPEQQDYVINSIVEFRGRYNSRVDEYSIKQFFEIIDRMLTVEELNQK